LPGEREPWPLDEREEALWLLQRMFPGQGVASLGFSFRLPPHVELPVLQRAVRWVVRRHPPLHSTVQVRDGRPFHVLRDPAQVRAAIERLATTPAHLDADIRAAAGRPFDPDHDELVRLTVFDLPSGDREFLVTAHHMVFDALSVPVFIRQLAAAYDSFAAYGQGPAEGARPWPGPPTTDKTGESLGYWRERIAGLRPASMMLDAGDYSDPDASFAGGRYLRSLSPSAAQAVHQLQRRIQVTDNVVLLAAYLLLLRRHGADRDLVVGVPVDLRPPDQPDLIGHNFSILPLRVRVGQDDSFAGFARQTFDAFFEALEHRTVSYETMAHRLLRHDYDWQAPLFRHLFNFWPTSPSQAESGPGPTIDDWIGGLRQVDTGYTRFDLELAVDVGDDDYRLQLAYRTDVHDEAFVRRFCDRYETLLESAAADPGIPAGRLSIATRHDRVVKQVNQTAVRWPGPKTTAGMIVRRMHDGPDDVAIVSAGAGTTYQQLGLMAGRVADHLVRGGVRAGDVVAIATGRGPLTAAAALAAWRAGAAYMPLDPRYPAERLRYQLGDSGAVAVVAGAEVAGLAADLVSCAVSPEVALQASATATAAVGREPAPDDLAYLIYTSGSTGRPKGVRITHANLANLIRHFARALEFDASKTMAWLTNFTFDISALELFLPLSCGGRVVVVGDQLATQPRPLLSLIEEAGVDVVQATPTLWRMIADLDDIDLRGRWTLSGGEPLTPALARRLLAMGARLLNEYGPTETTIHSTVAVIGDPAAADRPAVGVPIANTTVAVLDEFGGECPVDIAGEVVIAGAGVGAGYVHAVGDGASGFVRMPRMGGRAYRTGDVGRWRPDGQLELRGRLDRQVKLRGQRLELGEVEKVLEDYPGVIAAAAVLTGVGDDQRLNVFITSQPGVTAEELWNAATRRLPDYALPGAILFTDSLPTTASGKVDYIQLAELASQKQPAVNGQARLAAPADEIGTWLVTVWRDLLEEPALHNDSNFFLSGGESILAIDVTSRIRDRLGIEVPLVTIFRNPTPRSLRAALDVTLRGFRQDI
jgi:amino acid adenylation domain-containing protein